MIAIPEWGSLGVFLAAALLLLVTPGPAVLYIVARSVDQGRAAGLVSALGVHAGTLVHVAAAAAGLSVAARRVGHAVQRREVPRRRVSHLPRRPPAAR